MRKRKKNKECESEVSKVMVDFTKIKVANLNGTFETLDLSRIVANCIYSATPDVGIMELTRVLYREGKAEMTYAEINYFMNVLYQSNAVLAAFKEPLKKLLIDLLNKKENESNQN